MKRTGSTERGYGSRWQRARVTFLQSHPLCVMCEQEGRQGLASVVDHVIPHKGNMALFWDSGNWQALCKRHHDSDKRLQEHGTERPAIGRDGWPISK